MRNVVTGGVPVENGIDPSVFPSGLSRVPVTVSESKHSTEIYLLGGFLGVSQRKDDLALSPIVSWAVTTPVAVSTSESTSECEIA